MKNANFRNGQRKLKWSWAEAQFLLFPSKDFSCRNPHCLCPSFILLCFFCVSSNEFYSFPEGFFRHTDAFNDQEGETTTTNATNGQKNH